MLMYDTEFGSVGADRDACNDHDAWTIERNREAFDAVCEVPHSFDPVDRMVMCWCAALAISAAVIGWLS